MEQINCSHLYGPDLTRTIGGCSCPDKDYHILETAILEGMGQPTIERCLLRCILCGSTYRRDTVKSDANED